MIDLQRKPLTAARSNLDLSGKDPASVGLCHGPYPPRRRLFLANCLCMSPDSTCIAGVSSDAQPHNSPSVQALLNRSVIIAYGPTIAADLYQFRSPNLKRKHFTNDV